MTQPDISNAKDPDLRSAMAALVRAGALARKAALDAGTDLIIVKDGQLVSVQIKALREEPQASSLPAK